jgi:hypothetical protein
MPTTWTWTPEQLLFLACVALTIMLLLAGEIREMQRVRQRRRARRRRERALGHGLPTAITWFASRRRGPDSTAR